MEDHMLIISQELVVANTEAREAIEALEEERSRMPLDREKWLIALIR